MKAAARWFLAAAEQGHTRAQNHIGIRLARGEGVAKDPVKALMWLTLATRAGVRSAAKARDELAATMSIGKRAKAEQMAAEWEPLKDRKK